MVNSAIHMHACTIIRATIELHGLVLDIKFCDLAATTVAIVYLTQSQHLKMKTQVTGTTIANLI